MELVLVAALALALGFVLGAVAGAQRLYTLLQRRKALAGTSAAIAALLPESLPVRSSADILAGRIRVVLGGVPYDLPVKSRRDSRAWLDSLDERFGTLAAALEHADVPQILAYLAGHTDILYDLLGEYAGEGVLPVRDSPEDNATEPEILRATLEVWAALHPLAVALVANAETTEPPTSSSGTSPEPPRASPTPTAGAPEPSTS